MGKVLVIYASDYGHTKRAAELVAQGAESVDGTIVRSRSASLATADDVLDADGLIIGSPVHMGSVHWQIKRFIDETLSGCWTRDLLVGRAGGVFTTGGGLGGAGGGCEFAMLSMLAVLAELGVVLVPLPKSTAGFSDSGLHWGPYARCGTREGQQAELPSQCLPLLQAHGANIARVASLAACHESRSILGRIPAHSIERNSP
ncbi:MAG: flavodoxin domain-containing protein [Planctomycetota bacterium]